MEAQRIHSADDLALPVNTFEVLKQRYLLKDNQQRVIETPTQLFRRVASHIAKAEKNFKSSVSFSQAEETFYTMMSQLEFLPNSPTLMNAGTVLGQLSACFVLPVEDSIEGIFESLKNMAKIHQSGGGTGFDFSRIRPKHDLVSATKGQASGPVSFMSIFDQATSVIVQGGRRRGANMGILRADHPDIFEFIDAKSKGRRFENFNLSVGVTDAFMRAVDKNLKINLLHPVTGQKTAEVRAREIFDRLAKSAWLTGDPGLVFLDEINRANPTPDLGAIEATNPCGELPLLPYESCNLASINVARMTRGGMMDWDRLKERIYWGVRFLDDVIEMNRFPLPEIQAITCANRKIGLGIMGFADLLIMLGIVYGTEASFRFAEKLMRFVRENSLAASARLAEERGAFPNFEKSRHARHGVKLRHATLNTLAPTGTISIIAGCSSGIEPLFAVSFVRHVLSGSQLPEIHPVFLERVKQDGFSAETLLKKVTGRASIQSVKGIPATIRRLFVTAFDLSSRQHLKMQAAFQKYTDNSVSKTVNLPGRAAVNDVRAIYRLAYHLKCKGITIYRYGSKKNQVLTYVNGRTSKKPVKAESEYAGGCMSGECPF